MKLILTQPVSGLGVAGDVVDVKDGYARNYLLPRKVATRWTKGGERQVEAITGARAKRAHATAEQASAVQADLEGSTVVLQARAGASGRLYGAVTSSDVATAIAEDGGPQVDRRRIEIPTPIRSTGEHTVLVRLHEEVTATVTVEVVSA